MTHEELLAKLWILPAEVTELEHGAKAVHALRAVINLHSPEGKPDQQCRNCKRFYPCHTIQAIIKELQ